MEDKSLVERILAYAVSPSGRVFAIYGTPDLDDEFLWNFSEGYIDNVKDLLLETQKNFFTMCGTFETEDNFNTLVYSSDYDMNIIQMPMSKDAAKMLAEKVVMHRYEVNALKMQKTKEAAAKHISDLIEAKFVPLELHKPNLN